MKWISAKDRLPDVKSKYHKDCNGLYLTLVNAKNHFSYKAGYEIVTVPMVMHFSEKGWHITDVEVMYWVAILPPKE